MSRWPRLSLFCVCFFSPIALFCTNFLQQILKYTSKSLIYFQQRLIVSFFSLFCHNPERWNKSSVAPVVEDRKRITYKRPLLIAELRQNSKCKQCGVYSCDLMLSLLLPSPAGKLLYPQPPRRSLSGGLPTWWWVTQLCSAYTRHVSIHRHGEWLEDKTKFDDQRRIWTQAYIWRHNPCLLKEVLKWARKDEWMAYYTV